MTLSKTVAPGLLALCLLLLIPGCANIGPRSVVNDSFDYTGVLADSWKQRMLYNMVRLRYGDTPFFLDVASVINQYSVETRGQASIEWQTPLTGNANTQGIGGAITYTDRPTITYTPLSGEKFARSLMKPLPPAVVMGMIEAGYSVDLVMRTCVQSINGIRNRYSGQLATQSADAEYYPLLERLQRVQNSGSIDLRLNKSAEKELMVLRLHVKTDPLLADDIRTIRKTLDLDPATDEFKVVYGSKNRDDKEIALLTRSILQTINNLASYIEVPEPHVTATMVNPTIVELTRSGSPELPLIGVKSSSSKPDNAFVAVPYQSYWFWIDNRDLRSKRLFSFLMFLFSLTETSGKEGAPVVTINAGG